jgi:phospholipid/cholesterol/gamma-HCH transport system substrate-binding protein
VPSQQQLKWAQLRVGLTVIFASITLAVLVFLMTGQGGMFTKKIFLRSYVDNASGLRPGAPVRLQGVDIGNVTGIRIVPGKEPYPVEITMKITTKYIDAIHKDSIIQLSTAGVLGETFVDVDSTKATGPIAQSGDVLPMREQPDIQDVVRASQGTLQNLDVLLRRVDRIVSFVESGQGSIGKLIYDPTLYKQLNATVRDFQGIVNNINSGKGSIGKLINDDELYNKANASVDKLNSIVTQIDNGQGTVGKLIKDPSLYNNANETIAKANKLMDDVNAGRGTLGMLTKDEQFRAKLNDTVTRLNDLTAKLNSTQGSAGKFINDPAFYNNANNLMTESQNLIQAIRQNPKKYLTIHLKLF